MSKKQYKRRDTFECEVTPHDLECLNGKTIKSVKRIEYSLPFVAEQNNLFV